MCFTYAVGPLEVHKRIVMKRGLDQVHLIYELAGEVPQSCCLEVRPFLASRDFHSLRRRNAGEPFDLDTTESVVWLRDLRVPEVTLALLAACVRGNCAMSFEPLPDWWYNFRYRQEAARGMDFGEDLYTPGVFRFEADGPARVRLSAVFGGPSLAEAADLLDPPADDDYVPATREHAIESPDSFLAHLHAAADQFVVARKLADGRDSTTILAGYHWFGDWGRDAFIAMPGLLLLTERFTEALEVLRTFAGAQRDGLIPNRFDDYGGESAYNSVDASLWFIHAADAYLAATRDHRSWTEVLGPTCRRVIAAFSAGTDYDIRVDDDGLVSCGDPTTQITWMDARCGDVVFTPRHGKPVEVNALWYHALCVLGERLAEMDPAGAEQCRQLAERARTAFAETFWNGAQQCLYDVVRPDQAVDQIRPNQIFAVSLPHSPLSRHRQKQVVACVRQHLLTPFGLRTLSPVDGAYRGRYRGNPFERDGAYHQGTVWAWLLGPFVEAHLRAHNFSASARRTCRAWLRPMMEHIGQAGAGTISEIFDGDPPHAPGGCIAQAWSVAEILRAYHLVESEPAKRLVKPVGVPVPASA